MTKPMGHQLLEEAMQEKHSVAPSEVIGKAAVFQPTNEGAI